MTTSQLSFLTGSVEGSVRHFIYQLLLDDIICACSVSPVSDVVIHPLITAFEFISNTANSTILVNLEVADTLSNFAFACS